MKYKAFFFLLIVFVVSNAYTEQFTHLNQNTLPEKFKNLNLRKVGSAHFSILFWDIYKSSLYSKSGTYIVDKPSNVLLFEIEYLRDISSKDLIEHTIEQWQHLGVDSSEYINFIPVLANIWPDISSGDKLALFVKNNQSVFYFNNVKIGEIKQEEFSKLFLDIWLSKKTSQPKLRNALIGANSNE